MAKQNKPAEPERDPAEPIGMPPGGGRWTWDIPQQKWVSLNQPQEVKVQEVTELETQTN